MKETIESRELYCFIMNFRRTYELFGEAVRSLNKKQAKHIYNSEKANKMMLNVANAAAKIYAREYAEATAWHLIFNSEARKFVAAELLKEYEEEMVMG